MPCSRTIFSFACAAAYFAVGVCTQPAFAAGLLPVIVSFPSQTVLSTAQPYGSSVIVADFDGDGRPDVAAASLYDSEISWYRNLGNGAFSTVIVEGVPFVTDGSPVVVR